MNLTFISAGAGSGKTTKLTGITLERMRSGRCRPEGLIATTFTKKAAQELKGRVRSRLYQGGLLEHGDRLDESLVGTVHAVCLQLLERFAFEAGISPELRVIDEEEENHFFKCALEAVSSGETVEQVQRLADRLSHKDDYKHIWQKTACDIARKCRENGMDPGTLDEMARSSCREFLSFFPKPAGANLDQELEEVLETALPRFDQAHDGTKTTTDYVHKLRNALAELKQQRLPWKEWITLRNDSPGAGLRSLAEPVQAAAGSYASHPALHLEIEQYILLLFQLARQTLEEYSRMKTERGLLDYTDLEEKALELLTRPEVTRLISEEFDLLIVDEFQDTSPIQLALFMKLSALVKDSVWVGDLKQSIYAFRGTDPALIQTVISQLRQSNGARECLDQSYRSHPDLVHLCNRIFTPAFEKSLGLSPEEVALQPVRPVHSASQAALELWTFINPQKSAKGKPKRLKNELRDQALAEQIKRLLDPGSPCRVVDREKVRTGASPPAALRVPRPGDLAVLCRSNEHAFATAGALMNAGFTVSLAAPGLLSTPECKLALACLRRLVDPADTLATAEILALEGRHRLEEWLPKRLECLAQQAGENGRTDLSWGCAEPFLHPVIQALEESRPRTGLLSPRESLDLALFTAGVFSIVTTWGPSAARAEQRRANLETVRGFAALYERDCATTHASATVPGFLRWMEELAHAEQDARFSDESPNAIRVLTYHAAKGLEWPVVICADLEHSPKSGLFKLQVVPADPEVPFDLENPLANRKLRLWVWPFGGKEKNIPILDKLTLSLQGRLALQQSASEELRLLYVGFTRARDLLVLPHDPASTQHWLKLAEADWLLEADGSLILDDTGAKIEVAARKLQPPDDLQPVKQSAENLAWFPPPKPRTTRPFLWKIPSAQPPCASIAVKQTIETGSRVPVHGQFDETAMGHVIHALIAADFLDENRTGRLDALQQMLHSHGLAQSISPGELLCASDRFRALVLKNFTPNRVWVEVPFSTWTPQGQHVRGFIDLLLETPGGLVLIDHKSFPGRSTDWEREAIKHSGQIACYREALSAAGHAIASTWIHFVIGGSLLELS